MIYFISDTHFHHSNIIKYCNRPFQNVTEMNEILIANWNKVVKKEDEIYHLGDIALSSKSEFYDIAAKLNGRKYLIKGNHDHWRAGIYEEGGFCVLKSPPIKLERYNLLLSHTPVPDNQIPEGYINVHGHIHNILLSEWLEQERNNTYSLEKHINVSCDVIDFTPISIEELKRFKISRRNGNE